MSLIDGSYEYYHYLHDGIDDNGWGCAYRSLQTIFSWYRLQQYSSIDVPSHREIQQVLVEIGDKDPSFIGSREWIGAIELSFVLDKLLGVSFTIDLFFKFLFNWMGNCFANFSLLWDWNDLFGI